MSVQLYQPVIVSPQQFLAALAELLAGVSLQRTATLVYPAYAALEEHFLGRAGIVFGGRERYAQGYGLLYVDSYHWQWGAVMSLTQPQQWIAEAEALSARGAGPVVCYLMQEPGDPQAVERLMERPAEVPDFSNGLRAWWMERDASFA